MLKSVSKSCNDLSMLNSSSHGQFAKSYQSSQAQLKPNKVINPNIEKIIIDGQDYFRPKNLDEKEIWKSVHSDKEYIFFEKVMKKVDAENLWGSIHNLLKLITNPISPKLYKQKNVDDVYHKTLFDISSKKVEKKYKEAFQLAQ